MEKGAGGWRSGAGELRKTLRVLNYMASLMPGFWVLRGFCRTGGLCRPSEHPAVRSVGLSKNVDFFAVQPDTASGRHPSFAFIC